MTKVNLESEKIQVDDSPRLPTDNELQMLKELEALAKRIIDKKIQIGDAVYDVKLNELKDKYTGTTLKSLRKSLNVFLPELQTQAEEESHELDLLVEQDEPFTNEEKQEAEELLNQPDLFKIFYEDFKLTRYKADKQLTDAGLMVLGRTLLPTSSGEYGHGKLASGKTEFYNKIAEFFPLARTLSLTTFTEKFLFYAGGKDGNALQAFLLIYGESDMADRNGGDTFKQKYLRQLLTENCITQGTVETESKGKRHKAKYSVLNGPLTVVITGVDSPNCFDPQTASRLYNRHFKHTHQSILEVLKSKATTGNISTDPKPEDNTELLKTKRKWRCTFTKLLKYDPSNSSAINGIKISFLEELIFKKNRLTEADMRTYDRLKESITVSALLHQKTRKLNKGVLEAIWQDYFNIKESYLTSVPAAHGISNDSIDRFLELLKWWQKPDNAGQKSKTEIYRALNVIDNTGKKWIYSWLKAELLEDITNSDKKNAKKVYQLAANAELLVTQMQADENLGIEDVALPQSQRPADTKSQKLSTDEDSSRSELNETSKDQAENSTDQPNGNGVADLDQVSTGHSQSRPAKIATDSTIPNTANRRSGDLEGELHELR